MGIKDIEDDVYEFFSFVKSKLVCGIEFRGKTTEPIDSLEMKKNVDLEKFFKEILRDDAIGINEKITSRAGMVVCSFQREKTQKVLFHLGMLSSMLNKNFFRELCHYGTMLTKKGIRPEELDLAIEIYDRIIVIVEKIENYSENENERVAKVIRINVGINLAKIQIIRKMWEECLGNLLEIEMRAKQERNGIVLLDVYGLLESLYKGSKGDNSKNVLVYRKKHNDVLSLMGGRNLSSEEGMELNKKVFGS